MDREITAEAGRSVAAIFRAEGENGFRRREQLVGERLQRVDRVVISSGGGWPCVPGRLEGLAPGTLTIWLQVSPDEALRRISRSRTRRPLLEVEDPAAAARELLAGREEFYGRADWAVETDGRTPTEVARDLRDRLVGFGATN
jgi:shikimate kinase